MENKPKKILIIEDDHFISEMYARTLKKNGYIVEESTNGPDGFEKAKQGGWSFILLDIMLPDKTGVEILQELRAEGEDRDTTRIIIMTNFEQDDATRQSMEKLADGYLIKAEITPRRMLEIIQEMDGQQATVTPADTPVQPTDPEQDVEEEAETGNSTPTSTPTPT